MLQRSDVHVVPSPNGTPLRVCHLGKYYAPATGGIETHVQTLARAQAELGLGVRVICVDHSGGIEPTHGQRLGTLNAWCEDDGAVRVTRTARRVSVNRLDICPDLPAVLRSLEKEPADILHLHTPNPTMLLAMAMVRPNIPLVITHHSDIIRQKLLKLALRPFERFVYSRAARIQTTSPVYVQGSRFLERYNGRVEVLPLGLDLSPYSAPPPAASARADELKAKHGAPLWLAVGRLVYYKALHVALHALARIPGKLILIGAGPLEAELKDLARRLGVHKRVIWRGYVSHDELVACYRAATALWFPSNARSEAFGLVQVEAMASGCPVINTDIVGSGVPWVSQNETSGLTVPVNDPEALAAAARRLLDEPGLRDRLSRGGLRRAAEEFDHLTMAHRSLAIYQRALRGEPAAAAVAPEVVPARPARRNEGYELVDASEFGIATHLDVQSEAKGHDFRGAGFPDANITPIFRDPLRRD